MFSSLLIFIFILSYFPGDFSAASGHHAWDEKVLACVHDQNIGGEESGMTTDECKARCLGLQDCRGFDRWGVLNDGCWFKFTSKYTAEDYQLPCRWPYGYTEHYEMSSETDEWTAVTGACTVENLESFTDKNFEECKQTCAERVPECRSIEYRPGVCNLNGPHRNEDLQIPCQGETMEMTEYRNLRGSTYKSVGLNNRGVAGYRISTTNLATMFHCTLSCTQQGHCLSFGFNRATKECDLYRIDGHQLPKEAAPGFDILNAEEFMTRS